jgi:2-aminoadipate transaminase
MPKKLGRQTSQSANGLFRILGVDAKSLPRTRPLYRRLVTLLESAIARGTMAAGVRLPPERELAASLRVSRATVVSAYRELEARGLVRGYVGRGTFVSAKPDTASAPFAWRGKIAAAALQATDTTVRDLVRAASDPALMSLAAGVPALDCFPRDAFQRAMNHVITTSGEAAWRHGPTEGMPQFRAALADRFGGSPEHILVLAGAQQGLDLLARCLIDPGDAVIVDRPGYLGAIQTFRNAGARLVGWDISRADPDELEELLLRYRPKLIYTNPTHHNPTGITLSMRTRRELLELAARYRVPIVEDDTYRELALHSMPVPPPSLFKLDESHTVVIRLNSFAKMLAPGLRLGWISAVRPIIDQLALIKQQVDPHTQNLAQLVVCELVEQGVLDTHLATLRTEHRRRRDAMVHALRQHVPAGQLRFSIPEGGMYLWCELAPGVRARAVQDRALRESVMVLTGEPFYVDQGGDRHVRICYTSRPAGDAVRAAQVLARALAGAARDESDAPPIVRVV